MQNITQQERNRLLTAWHTLDQEGQRTVRLFAEFLSQQAECQTNEPIQQEPLPIPKPERESAVFALKRLKKTYPMIEADFSLLEEASQLILKRVMGATDTEVIGEMEALFTKKYQIWREASMG